MSRDETESRKVARGFVIGALVSLPVWALIVLGLLAIAGVVR